MDRARFKNTIVTMTEGVAHKRLAADLAHSGISFHSLGMRRGRPSLAAALHMLSITRRTQPDVLQTWMYHADLLGTVIGKLARVPSLVWNLRCSSLIADDNRPRSQLIVRLLAKLSSYPKAILANSQAGIQFHSSIGYSPRDWRYIPNSLDVTAFHPDDAAPRWLRAELNLQPDIRLIGLIARFHPAKDHASFIEAAHQLGIVDPRVHFVLVGTAISEDNASLMDLINATHIRDQFHLLGHRTDIRRVTAGLDISCSSSISEGSSNVITEAMACGVPCVATDVGDSSSVLGSFGKIVPPRNPQAIAQACMELLSLSQENRSALGQNARRRAEHYFSLASVVAQYERFYESLPQ